MLDLNSLYFKFREPIRLNPLVSRAIYFAQSLRHSNFGDFRRQVLAAREDVAPGEGVALCCRIRDEAPYLKEFVEYYLAAGVGHIFFYEKLSRDNFKQVLEPYIERGVVTLFSDWPHVPVSPAAEQDCVLRCIGRFKWVGFIDADEFVVIEDGRSIEEFLSGYLQYPSVALHNRLFGSNGHKNKPQGLVIAEYTRREKIVDIHVKCFIQPKCAANYRNSHSWYYLGMRRAVNELGEPVSGSFSLRVTAVRAWINHYHLKSEQEYFEKAAPKSVLDNTGMKFQMRTVERRNMFDAHANAVADDSSVTYYRARCQASRVDPIHASEPIHTEA